MADHIVGPDPSGFAFSPAAIVFLVLLSNATVVCFHLWTIVTAFAPPAGVFGLLFNVVQCNVRCIILIISIPIPIPWARALPDAAVIPRFHEVAVQG